MTSVKVSVPSPESFGLHLVAGQREEWHDDDGRVVIEKANPATPPFRDEWSVFILGDHYGECPTFVLALLVWVALSDNADHHALLNETRWSPW